MACVALFDRYADQHPRRSDFVRPDRFRVRHAGALDVMADQRRPRDRAVPRQLVGRAEGRATVDDGIVAMVDGLDVEYWLFANVAAVVAGPLAERPFLFSLLWIDEALQDDLGIGRD